MKNAILKFGFLLAMCASSFALVSCNGDGGKDDVIAADKTVTDVSIEYLIDLADSYYKYFDINVDYMREDGEIISMCVTENWDYSFSANYEATPENIIFKVVATPKAELPTIEEDANYNCSAKVYVIQTGYTKEGVENEKFGYSGSYKTNGYKSYNDWVKYTSKDHILLNYNYPKGPANPVE